MRLTENAVMLTKDGQIAYVRLTPHPDAQTKHKKIREIVLATTGTLVPLTDAAPLAIVDVASMCLFVQGFNGLENHPHLPVKPHAGYDAFWNQFGPTNPQTPRKINNEGLVKVIAPFLHILIERSVRGDNDATRLLDIVLQYPTEARKHISAIEKVSLLETAAAGFTPEEIEAAKARLTNIPQASVTVAEANDVEEEVAPSEVEVTA